MKILWHFLVLIASFAIVFIWEQTPLADYTIQGLALLVIFYLLISFIRKKRNPQAQNFSGSSDIFILTTAILLLVSVTGNLYSPLFFLVYFLGFGITFIFEPASVFLYTVGAILIFLPEALKNGSLESFLRLGSIVLISPLAYFFGREYQDRETEEAEMEAMTEREKDAADTISQDVEGVLKNEQSNLKQEDVDKLNEILEEADDLRSEK